MKAGYYKEKIGITPANERQYQKHKIGNDLARRIHIEAGVRSWNPGASAVIQKGGCTDLVGDGGRQVALESPGVG